MRNYLKELRDERGLTQKTVADALGISQNHYSCIENGIKQKDMDLSILVKLSEIFNVSLEWLIKKEKEKGV